MGQPKSIFVLLKIRQIAYGLAAVFAISLNYYNNTMKNTIILFLITICTLNAVAQKRPAYSQYTVKIEKKTAKKVLLSSHPKAKMFRTNLKEALATSQVNFCRKIYHCRVGLW
jgi:hypothetical protein